MKHVHNNFQFRLLHRKGVSIITNTMNFLLPRQQEIFEICKIISEQEDLKATFNEAGTDALIMATGGLIGGLLGGRRGAAVGGALSSLLVACIDEDDYKSVITILNEMTKEEKQKLVDSVDKIIKSYGYRGAVMGVIVLGNWALKQKIITEIGNFIESEKNYKLVGH